jgi:hypothetical protein
MVEGHVPQGVEVQVLSSAQLFIGVKNPRFGDFCLRGNDQAAAGDRAFSLGQLGDIHR